MFAVGDKVRYKPGFGTYGYEGVLDADGRVAGVVVGFSETRVRVETINERGAVVRAVDATNLQPDDGTVPIANRNGVPDQTLPPALFEEPGRVWRGWSPRYVCVAVERDAAAEALLDHLNRAHDSRRPEYIQGFDTNFEPVRKLDGRATH